MIKRHAPVTTCPHMLHGADYNPDQWQHMPRILEEDMGLMKRAGCNIMSVGIFSWTALEPREGVFTFDWLDTTMDRLAANDAYAALATPSAARPAWMAEKYPEVLRVTEEGIRRRFGGRANHCLTSSIYRAKCRQINERLAQRYKGHPALALWHVSNEYHGECWCDLCAEAFRAWLRRTYEDNLEALNRAWNTAFWNHTYTAWSQIAPPSAIGQKSTNGHNLDWKRFVTDQTIDFYEQEAAPLREITPGIPVTTNCTGLRQFVDYFAFTQHLDIAGWDCYPRYDDRHGDVSAEAVEVSFTHDLYRAMKGGKPWLLMESSPSATNWMDPAKLKRPGIVPLTGMQAVAHGADGVLYFQFRKSRGGAEKFHGAIVDHVGHENTRVFREVARVGKDLAKLDEIVGTTVLPEVCVIYDWQNNWAMDQAAALGKTNKKYAETCIDHYKSFWHRGIPVDILDSVRDFSACKLLVAPMLYMVRPGVAERIEDFVLGGGTFVTTYWSGIVDENDLCHLGGFPGPLRSLCGVWSEEIDALYEDESNRIMPVEGNQLGLDRSYVARELCDLIHAENAEVLATYGDDFYAGRPALTVNRLDRGKAYYIASRNDDPFHHDFYGRLVRELGIRPAIETTIPEGVTAQVRTDGTSRFVFLMNFCREPRELELGDARFVDVLSGEKLSGALALGGYGYRVLREGNPGTGR